MASPIVPGVVLNIRRRFAPDAPHAGDEQAWGALFDQHYPRIYRFCRARVTTDDTAADLASQVFMDAFHATGRSGMAALPSSASLFTIAARVLSDHLATRGHLSGTGGLAPHVRDEYVADETRERLRRLPSDYQSALELRYLLRLTSEEAAAAMGLPSASFQSLLLHATQAFGEVRPSRRT